MGSYGAADEPILFQFGAVTVSSHFFYRPLKLFVPMPRFSRMR